ncbi:uncharacterized protein LOC127904492 isoform X3 [Populus trichocarpa]|uniref:uncharacterized protein LOC127904492 isoform X3 n=1 Tax=Populus trichocarpa TaxID=3694 RepID=UPI002279B6A7|nr:uncharacterized protein LOC127904492 isoform X3 [Populus trichocarpa]
MELKFVEPVAKNGKELAQVNEEDVASEFKRWENAVVAYFLGHDSTFGPTSFNKFINNLIDSEWRKYGNVKVYSQGSGVFVLDFESAHGKELALGEGPRFYDGSKPFILKPWSRDLSLEIKELKSAPIWIKLPNLRLHLWSPEALSKIASLVGRPLFADTVTASRETLCFARVCVEVDFDKMLPDSVTIEDDKGYSYDQKVEYEWQPTSRCSYCLHLGHSDSCPRRKTTFPCSCCKEYGRFCSKRSGGPARFLFGTAQGAANTSSETTFGSTPAPAFGSTPAPAFGSTPAPTFGSTLFGTTAPGANSPQDDARTSLSTPAFGSERPPAE